MATFTKKKIVALTAAFVIVGGAAFAYWTAGGEGGGSADTGTSEVVTIVQTALADDALYPGGEPVALSGTFTNDNDGPTYVGQVSVAIEVDWDAQADLGAPACTEADFELVQPTATNGDVITGTTWGGGSIQLVNAATNQDNCKSVTVPLVYTSS
ncbi:hypothetical protein GCM10023350_14160 [Nocardioides endophyticus]|uniref:Uncharacterized protein n=1 Tax=Nocardioides endophyticus TaxID=1353775 RepID=A0ABP8YLG4_9ACTN